MSTLPALKPDFSIAVQFATPKDSAMLLPRQVMTDPSEGNASVSLFSIEVYSNGKLNDAGRNNFIALINHALPDLVSLLREQEVLQVNTVHRLCVAEPDIMGDVIANVQASVGLKPDYTKEGHYVVMGRTIGYRVADKVQSSIILNSDIFFNVINALAEARKYEEWDFGEHLSFYLMAHEFGHALDNCFREEISVDSALDDDDFDWERLGEHYAPMMLNEFTACRLASKAVTSAVQQDSIKAWEDDVEKFTDILIRKRNAFMTDFREVASAFWLILLQYSKLLGQDPEAVKPPTYPNPEWEDPEIAAERNSVLTKLEDLMEGYAMNYPKIPSAAEITEELKPLFLALAGTHNFYFREEDAPADITDS